MSIDIQKIRGDFPALDQLVTNDRPLVYLDNAATTLKPQCVVDAITQHYQLEAANVHRGVHYLSEQATIKYEDARHKVKQFLNATTTGDIIFTSGTTASINLVAKSFGGQHLGAGDEVVITHMEHHSNIVPWQMLTEQTGCKLKVAPINDAGEVMLDEFEKLLTPKTKMVSIVHISNSLGTINPIKEMIRMAHDRDIAVLIDGAQAVAHQTVDVHDLDCDFYAFSAHKLFGPTGVGVLYGKSKWLDEMEPITGGGDMILSVTFEKTTYNTVPHKFEAGTPHIAGVIGLGAAIDYVNSIGLSNIEAYENELLIAATNQLNEIPGIRFFGTAANKTAVVSFLMEDIHPHDIGSLLDLEGVAIRSGHHCTQPVMERYNVPATARASFSLYNTLDEIETLVQALYKAKEVFV